MRFMLRRGRGGKDEWTDDGKPFAGMRAVVIARSFRR